MRSVYEVIQLLKNTSSRNEKEAILREEKDNTRLQQVLILTYNPTINYYIKKIPSYAKRYDTGINGLSWAITELEPLYSRKVTGNDAIEHLTTILENLSNEDSSIIEMIITRDLDCGISTSTINKIWKNFIPETPYMRCSLYKQMKHTDLSKGYISQTKEDGSFANINNFKDSAFEMFTRNGTRYDDTKFTQIKDTFKSRYPEGYQYHGELVVYQDGEMLPRQVSNGILNTVLKGGNFESNQVPHFIVWDMVPIKHAVPGGSWKIPYKVRYENLLMIDEEYKSDGPSVVKLVETRIVYTMEQAWQHFRDNLLLGLEGTILKDPDGIWEDRTSPNMWKLKLDVDVDLEVVKFNPGNGKNKSTFGSIECKSSDGLLVVNVSGFTDKERQELCVMGDSLIGKIMVVRSNSIMFNDDGPSSLFLPRFIEIRDDKTVADTFQQIVDQFDSAMKGKL